MTIRGWQTSSSAHSSAGFSRHSTCHHSKCNYLYTSELRRHRSPAAAHWNLLTDMKGTTACLRVLIRAFQNPVSFLIQNQLFDRSGHSEWIIAPVSGRMQTWVCKVQFN